MINRITKIPVEVFAGQIYLGLGIKPEPEALYPKYPNPYPFSPKPVTQIAPAGNETGYPN
jgi:hypothetical protein